MEIHVKSCYYSKGSAVNRVLPGFWCAGANRRGVLDESSISGPLPGKSLVVYDTVLRLPIDVFPCEDGHAQERSLLKTVLTTIVKDDAWIADRNFCTIEFTCGIDDRGAFFIIREHGNYPFQLIGKEKYIGKTDTGKVYEQRISVIDELGREHIYRRIRVALKKETRDGDTNIFIITNLSRSKASTKRSPNCIVAAGPSRPPFSISPSI